MYCFRGPCFCTLFVTDLVLGETWRAWDGPTPWGQTSFPKMLNISNWTADDANDINLFNEHSLRMKQRVEYFLCLFSFHLRVALWGGCYFPLVQKRQPGGGEEGEAPQNSLKEGPGPTLASDTSFRPERRPCCFKHCFKLWHSWIQIKMVLESIVRKTEVMIYNEISIKNAFLSIVNLFKGNEED